MGDSSGLASLLSSVADVVAGSTENSCAVVSDVSSSQEAKEKLMRAALAAMLIRPRWADDLGIRYCFHIEAVDERSKGRTLRCSGVGSQRSRRGVTGN